MMNARAAVTQNKIFSRTVNQTRVQATLLALTILGGSCLMTGAQAGVPAVSNPECVPVPGMPCPGSASSSSSSTSRSTYSTSSRSAKPSSNAIMLKGLQSTIDRMTTPNPATLRKIQQTRMEGDRAQQEAVQLQQTQEEQRRRQALHDAERARMKQLQDLSDSLQGLPETTSSGSNLRPAGTPFFGQRIDPGTTVPSGPDIKALRAAGSSGFDTQGPLVGQLPPLPPAPPLPTPVTLQEKLIPAEKITPETQLLIQERESLRERKKEMQESLTRFESKGTPTSEESAAMTQLQQDLSATLNKENYLTFSINESLP